jgi:hypothetical protein
VLQQKLQYLQQRAAVLEVGNAVRHMTAPQLQLSGCKWLDCPAQQDQYSADAAVAGRKGVVCGGCGLARYCCPQHQQEDWPRHRQVCRRLAQATAAAGVSRHSSSSHVGA